MIFQLRDRNGCSRWGRSSWWGQWSRRSQSADQPTNDEVIGRADVGWFWLGCLLGKDGTRVQNSTDPIRTQQSRTRMGPAKCMASIQGKGLCTASSSSLFAPSSSWSCVLTHNIPILVHPICSSWLSLSSIQIRMCFIVFRRLGVIKMFMNSFRPFSCGSDPCLDVH